MNEQWLEKLVVGSLKQAIVAHGPIDSKWIGSAAKRISHQIFGEVKAAFGGEGHEICKIKEIELESEIRKLKSRNSVLIRTADHWRVKYEQCVGAVKL